MHEGWMVHLESLAGRGGERVERLVTCCCGVGNKLALLRGLDLGREDTVPGLLDEEEGQQSIVRGAVLGHEERRAVALGELEAVGEEETNVEQRRLGLGTGRCEDATRVRTKSICIVVHLPRLDTARLRGEGDAGVREVLGNDVRKHVLGLAEAEEARKVDVTAQEVGVDKLARGMEALVMLEGSLKQFQLTCSWYTSPTNARTTEARPSWKLSLRRTASARAASSASSAISFCWL